LFFLVFVIRSGANAALGTPTSQIMLRNEQKKVPRPDLSADWTEVLIKHMREKVRLWHGSHANGRVNNGPKSGNARQRNMLNLVWGFLTPTTEQLYRNRNITPNFKV
jgi:hypothetical protein